MPAPEDPVDQGAPRRPAPGAGDSSGMSGNKARRGNPVPPRGNSQPGKPVRRAGGLNLRRLGGNDYEFIHPRCVEEMELDYEEGIEFLRAGDPESARDALRYALQGCGDNIWVHVALGKIALEEFKDPSLARGHYGYAYELADRAIPPDFTGRLPRDRFANRPFYEAIEGLAVCYDALGKPNESRSLRGRSNRFQGLRGGDQGRKPMTRDQPEKKAGGRRPPKGQGPDNS